MIGVLLIGLRRTARTAMSVGFLVTVGLAIGVWGVAPVTVAAASLQGTVIALEILAIVLGAMLLLATMDTSGAMATIRAGFTRISPDRRIQAIVVAWAFGTFIEGVSGFGTPALLVAPLLLALGFPAMAAVTVALLIQSTPVTFGALGTPILVGIRGGLAGTAAEGALRATGSTLEGFLVEVTRTAATIHAVVGVFVPLVLVMVLTRLFGEHRDAREGLAVWRFALLAGLAFVVPSWLTARFLGPEFPSVVGGLVALAVTVGVARAGFLQPSVAWDFAPADRWPSAWSGVRSARPAEPPVGPGPLRAWGPYALLVAVLVVTRLPALGVAPALRRPALAWNGILGQPGIDVRLEPLYLPGMMFLVATLGAVVLHRMSVGQVRAAWSQAGRRIVAAAPPLLLAVALVRVFVTTGVDAGGDLPSMPLVLAEGASRLVGRAWPGIAPMVGALGAFAAGSNTISNIMFAQFQFATAQVIDASPVIVVAAQAVGGAAGSMGTVPHVVAAAATVGLIGREGELLRRVVPPMVAYLLVAGALALLLVPG